MSSHETAAALDGDLASIVDAFRTCELATVTRSGTPIAWPTVNLLRPDGTFLITTSIALPQKAYNVRRDPRVALLFSDPTGSGLGDPPHVLVQGRAACPEEIVTSATATEGLRRRLLERQPISRQYSRTAIGRYLFDWYYMRLFITVTPAAVRTRPAPGFAAPLATSGQVRGTGDDPFGLAARRLPEFTSAVLTAFDDDGQPTLVRVRPQIDTAARRFVVPVPEGHAVRPGPASLLCHSHDEQLWNLCSFVVAGELVRAGDAWILAPSRFVLGGDRIGPVGMIRAVRQLRRTARGYLAARGLERPRIPWDEYQKLRADVAS
jgi:hypothetical protein